MAEETPILTPAEEAVAALKLIGMAEADARVAVEGIGFRCRITRRDATYYVMTRDFRPHDRVNINIDSGLVSSYHLG